MKIQPRRAGLEGALLAAALLPLVLAAALIAHDYRQTEAEVHASVMARMQALHGHVGKLLEVNTVLLERMAEHFDGLPIARIRAQERIHHEYLAALQRNHGDVSGLAIIGPDGYGAAHSHIVPVPKVSAGDRDYFNVHREAFRPGLFVSQPLESRVAKEPGFTLSRRRGAPGDAFDGIYNASIRSGQIQRFWQQSLRPGAGEAVGLYRTDGMILARHPLPPGAPARLPDDAPILRLMRAGAEGLVEATSPVDRRERIAAARRVEGFPLYVVYSVDREAAFGAWRRDSALLAGVAFAMTALLLALALVLVRRNRVLAEAGAELAEAARRKDEFIAALAHELRNPLGAIANSAMVLERYPGTPQSGLAVPIIGRQVRQLQRMVDDLLDTARSLHGKLAVDRQPLDVRALLENAVGLHRERAGARVRLAARGPAAWVEGDAVRLAQVLDNLLENAVKYGARSVDASVRTEGPSIVVEVRDDGEGIPPELLPRLFEPFVQGTQTLARSRGGLGLGLALVRRLVELHGGTVHAESGGSGQGTKFVVRLPACAPPEASPAPAPEPAPAGARRRVLIVEDQEDARESLRALLALDGHEVSVAASGPEGLAEMARALPDVALIDVGLPDMDGYEVARRARLLANAPGHPRLVALTGYGQDHDRRQALDAGFDLHLTKPVSYEMLQQVLA